MGPESRIRSNYCRSLPLFFLFTVFFTSYPTAWGSPASDQGRAWLLANQGADASWSSARDPEGIRSTAKTLTALGAQAPVDAQAWLLSRQAKSLEESAAASLALGALTSDFLLTPVNTHRIGTGNWASGQGMPADPYHTSLALIAIVHSETADLDEIASAADYLALTQNADGSWSTGEDGQETAITTALAARALVAAGISGSTESLVSARQWLIDNQNIDGGWGIGGSAVGTTARVLTMLRWLGCPLLVEESAVSFIESSQSLDGSWIMEGEADPWTTAVATSTLAAAGAVDLSFAVGGVVADPDPVPGDSWKLEITIANYGAAPASSALVRAILKDAADVEAALLEQTIEILNPGETTTIELIVDTAALDGVYAWTVDLDPDDMIREGNETNNHAQGSLTVGGWRNLSVVADSVKIFTFDGLLELDPSNLAVGTQVLVKAQVSVEGTHGAGPLELWIYWGNPADGILVGTMEIPELAQSQTLEIEFPWTIDAPPGQGWLAVVIDPRGLVAQTDASNDRIDLAAAIGAADMIAPEPPEGLTAYLQSKDHVDLSWWASPSTDVVGYRLYRDGIPLNAVDIAPWSEPSASDSYNLREYLPEEFRDHAAFDPPNMIDEDPDTSWWSIQLPFQEWEPEPCFVQFDFGGPESFRGINIQWFDFDYAGKDFRIQTWDGKNWIDQVEIEDNLFDRSTIILPAAIVTDKIRIEIDEGLGPWFVGIRDVEIFEAGPGRLVTGLSFVDQTLPGLPATYTATAVDAAGNESEPSEPFTLNDLTPPYIAVTSPVDNQRVGPEVLVRGTITDEFLMGYALDWVEGDYTTENPVEWNRADQRAEPVIDGHLLTWNPPAGLDGPCTIRVTAIDFGGIANIREERILLWVDTVPPARPVGLVSSLSEDKATLTWQPNTEPDLGGYIVWVNNEMEGVTDVAKEGTASASATYSDAFVTRSPENANDGDKGSYWRPPENSYPCWWQMDFAEAKPVRRVVLTWQYPMVPTRFQVETQAPDGSWTTRWSTRDNDSWKSYVDLTVASHAKAIRVTIFEAVLWGQKQSPLDLQDPPAPYPVLTEVEVLAQKMLTTELFETVFEEKREYGLTVEAVDDVGNRSSMSQAEIIDLLGPRVAILTPKPRESLGRAVAINGIVADRYLEDYVLEVGGIAEYGAEPANWEEIHHSIKQVGVDEAALAAGAELCPYTAMPDPMMTVWYPTLVKGLYKLRLTARDQFDNFSVSTVEFSIDAMPPESPTNLVGMDDGVNVTLAWDPSLNEADQSGPVEALEGYRVYRDGIPMSIPNVAFLGKANAPTPEPKLQGYPKFMIDALLESSWEPEPFSEEAEVIVDLPQPFVVSGIEIYWAKAEWKWGRDYSIDVWDQTAGLWTPIAQVEGSIAPIAEYAFAPFATDRVRITLTKGPTAYSLGAIAEIAILRETLGDLIPDTTYTDPSAVGQEAIYRVTAMDEHGNESPKSNKVWIDEIPPRVAITEPVDGILRVPARTAIEVKATIDDPLLTEYRIEAGPGENPIFWQTLAQRQGDLIPVLTPAALAIWSVPDNYEGWYTIRLTALDQGNASSSESVSVYIDTKPPPAPTGLVAALQTGGVQLDWQAVVDAGLDGYHIYRNGKRLDLQNIAVNGIPKASSFYCTPRGECFYPDYTIDEDPNSHWKGMKYQVPAWVRLLFDGYYPVETVNIDFYPWMLARDFSLQTWDRTTSSWVDQDVVVGLDQNPYQITFPEPIPMEGFRIRMTGLMDGAMEFGIREIILIRGPGAETPLVPNFFDDAISDLEYSYKVTAFDDFGNESIPSNEVQMDDMFPRVTLDWPPNGERVGAHVEVEGTIEDWRLLDYRLEVGKGETPASDEYEVVDVWERHIEDNVVAVWDPPAGEDGLWQIRLVARDLSGNETAVERSVWVDTTPPETPQDFVATAIGLETVQLDWSPVIAADLAGYNVYRDRVLLNDPLVSPWGVATASTNSIGAKYALDAQYGGRGQLGRVWTAIKAPCYWQEDFPGDVTIDLIELFWIDTDNVPPPRDYEFQVHDGNQWNTVFMVWDNAFGHRFHEVPMPATGSRFRILITGVAGGGTANELPIGLIEARFWDNSRSGPVAETYYLDEGLVEIGYTYQVSALDDLKNESPLTDGVMLDDAAPTVSILSPASNEIATGPVSIVASAQDVNLNYWRLELGDGESPERWVELAYGREPVADAVFAEWTPDDNVDASYALRLTALDRAGNLSTASTTFQVFTMPPSIPLGLAAVVNGQGDVELSWGAPEFGDVVGYNVYRNGEKLNRTNLAPLATASASTYSVVRRPPLPDTGFPADAIDGDPSTYWLPEPGDNPPWLNLEFNQKFNIAGIVIDWFETIVGEKYIGVDYQIQVRQDGEWETVVFIENNSDVRRVDPFPEPVFTDAIRIRIARGTDGSFAGVIREVKVLSANQSDLVTSTNFTDTGLLTMEGLYTVKSVDSYGKESMAAAIVMDDQPPFIYVSYPLDNEKVPGAFTIEGIVEDPTLSEIEVSFKLEGEAWDVQRTQLKPGSKDKIAWLNLVNTPYEGPAYLRIRAWDKAGNFTETVVPVFLDRTNPEPPTQVSAAPMGNAGAMVTWTPSTSIDVVGYYVERQERTINPGNLVEAAVASASGTFQNSVYHEPWAAIDGLPDTAWWSEDHSGPKMFEVAFTEPVLISSAKYDFIDGGIFLPIFMPIKFEIEAYVNSAWIFLGDEQSTNVRIGSAGISITLAEPVLADRLRITVTEPNMIGLEELEIKGPGLVLGTEYWDTELAAVETSYRVVAVDEVGNKSIYSETFYLDAAPPLVELTEPAASSLSGAMVSINVLAQDPNLDEVELSWGIGASPVSWTQLQYWWQGNGEFDRYRGKLFSRGVQWDASGIEAVVTLRLWAKDHAGNESIDYATFSVDGNLPGTATDLMATIQIDGASLSWAASPDSDVAGYLVLRDGLVLNAQDVSPFGIAWASSYAGVLSEPSMAIDDDLTTYASIKQNTDGQIFWGIDFDEPIAVEGVELDLYQSSTPPSIVVEKWTATGWGILASVTDNSSKSLIIPFGSTLVESLRIRFPVVDAYLQGASICEVRILPTGPKGPMVETSFTDTWLSDPFNTEHSWAAVAVDQAGNLSEPSEVATIDTINPRVRIDLPVEGDLIGAQLEVLGLVEDRLLDSWSLTVEIDGEPPLLIAQGNQSIDGDALVLWNPPSNLDASVLLRLSAVDSTGNESETSVTVTVDTIPPGAPGAPVATYEGNALNVSWPPSVDSDIAGYIVYRNGEPLQARDISHLNP